MIVVGDRELKAFAVESERAKPTVEARRGEERKGRDMEELEGRKRPSTVVRYVEANRTFLCSFTFYCIVTLYVTRFFFFSNYVSLTFRSKFLLTWINCDCYLIFLDDLTYSLIKQFKDDC